MAKNGSSRSIDPDIIKRLFLKVQELSRAKDE